MLFRMLSHSQQRARSNRSSLEDDLIFVQAPPLKTGLPAKIGLGSFKTPGTKQPLGKPLTSASDKSYETTRSAMDAKHAKQTTMASFIPVEQSEKRAAPVYQTSGFPRPPRSNAGSTVTSPVKSTKAPSMKSTTPAPLARVPPAPVSKGSTLSPSNYAKSYKAIPGTTSTPLVDSFRDRQGQVKTPHTPDPEDLIDDITSPQAKKSSGATTNNTALKTGSSAKAPRKQLQFSPSTKNVPTYDDQGSDSDDPEGELYVAHAPGGPRRWTEDDHVEYGEGMGRAVGASAADQGKHHDHHQSGGGHGHGKFSLKPLFNSHLNLGSGGGGGGGDRSSREPDYDQYESSEEEDADARRARRNKGSGGAFDDSWKGLEEQAKSRKNPNLDYTAQSGVPVAYEVVGSSKQGGGHTHSHDHSDHWIHPSQHPEAQQPRNAGGQQHHHHQHHSAAEGQQGPTDDTGLYLARAPRSRVADYDDDDEQIETDVIGGGNQKTSDVIAKEKHKKSRKVQDQVQKDMYLAHAPNVGTAGGQGRHEETEADEHKHNKHDDKHQGGGHSGLSLQPLLNSHLNLGESQGGSGGGGGGHHKSSGGGDGDGDAQVDPTLLRMEKETKSRKARDPTARAVPPVNQTPASTQVVARSSGGGTGHQDADHSQDARRPQNYYDQGDHGMYLPRAPESKSDIYMVYAPGPRASPKKSGKVKTSISPLFNPRLNVVGTSRKTDRED